MVSGERPWVPASGGAGSRSRGSGVGGDLLGDLPTDRGGFEASVNRDAAEELLDAAKERVLEALEVHSGSLVEPDFLQTKIKEVLGKFVYEQTRRRPMILPVIQQL